jgi:hypothetical protein
MTCAIAVTLALSACGGGRAGRGDGGGGGSGDASNGRDGGGIVVPVDCTEAARWVYVIDSDRQLLRFQPDDLSLTPIGTVSCGASTPFSMSVDRDARAWVLHQDGNIFHVSTLDASCAPTGFAPDQAGFELFGMGFVADADMSTEETLFVAGGAESSIATGSSSLGAIDEGSLVLSRVGSIPGWPELTGTGSGELWGFFPDTDPPSVRRLDKTTGATEESFDFEAIAGTTPSAWAFAFWGGRFYVFLQTTFDPSTNVWRLDPRDGSFTEVLSDIGYRIVGAGVSTCAPVDLI